MDIFSFWAVLRPYDSKWKFLVVQIPRSCKTLVFKTMMQLIFNEASLRANKVKQPLSYPLFHQTCWYYSWPNSVLKVWLSNEFQWGSVLLRISCSFLCTSLSEFFFHATLQNSFSLLFIQMIFLNRHFLKNVNHHLFILRSHLRTFSWTMLILMELRPPVI